ncbi:MAG: acyltransferase family protein [Sulfuricellaceae bacterium]|nr:acyltransferase family protein [Sulfuricellaceae bacterium]
MSQAIEKKPVSSRFAHVDIVKAVASQLIVLHHLAFYGPLSDSLFKLAPEMVSWMYDYARMAVQAFLVVGGFLAARSLAPQGKLLLEQPIRYLAKRYVRLVYPFAVALLLAILAAWAARIMTDLEFVPDSPKLKQLLAHLFLLHNVLNVDALSAGVWYVAIDFQLTALFLLLLWLSRKSEIMAVMAVASLGVAALFFFNLDANWDVWAIYFFGSYALGVAAFWSSRASILWLAAIVLAVVLAMLAEYRLRILVALAVALFLALAQHGLFHSRALQCMPHSAVIQYLSRTSYSLFLVHFAVLMLANAVFERFFDASPSLAVMLALLAWATSMAAADVFYRRVERANPGVPEFIRSGAAMLFSFVKRIPGWLAEQRG